MAGGGFMNRVMTYLVNELLVNSLANSPTFQRFAVRTSKTIEDFSKEAVKKRQELAEQLKDISRNFEFNVADWVAKRASRCEAPSIPAVS
ncbi:hypothetical protein ACLOJK_023596 [Asimina triloba]